ncbi:hypothetical protein FRB96_001929 [Tulasnella sp. 330]|nr:hypothetical protein FRB96_001929 [Tulasnella sp. 330]KAG8886444.1 hypothetical protein FRB98_001263 [Tulasnella sp. 332]
MVSSNTALALSTLCLLVFISGRLARKYVFIPRFTILAELKYLGVVRSQGRIPGTAVICGGSIAGLLAAAVCADNFESVLIVEPDACTNDERGIELPVTIERRTGSHGAPAPISDRKRVMQWFCTHILHPVSYMALQRLFPNDLNTELQYFQVKPAVAQWKAAPSWEPYRECSDRNDITSGAPLSIPLSRAGYETLLRRLVKKSRPNVEFSAGTVIAVRDAKDALQSNTLDRVVVRNPSILTLDGGNLNEVQARLVIDATGPAQAGFTKWLKAAGYDANHVTMPHLRDEYKPTTQVVNAIYTVPSHLHAQIPVPGGFKPGMVFIFNPDPSLRDKRGIWSQITEGNQLLVGMGGPGMTRRPHSASEFVTTLLDHADFKHGRMPPWILDLCRFLEEHEAECEPFWTDLTYPSYHWVKYQEAPYGTLPRNFAVVGDASMRLNPLAAQGCTKAMYDVVALNSCLNSVPSGATQLPEDFSIKFFQTQALRIEHMW